MSTKTYSVIELEPKNEHKDEDLQPGFALVRRIDGHEVPLAFEPTLEGLEAEAARLSGRYLLFLKGGPNGPELAGDFQTLEGAKKKMRSISYDMIPRLDFWIEREGDGVVFGERPGGQTSLSKVMGA